MLGGIIRNLFSNAVKFSSRGGCVCISARQISEGAVEISIKDTGIGMNKEIAENLFNMNVVTNRKGTSNEASTGLGLIICREFIEKHNGKLWIESEEGSGSSFYFTLPNQSGI